MLYDPKWEAETKADPFSLETLIAWLERKPANESYCYTDNGHCLFAQYFTDMGFKDVWVLGAGAFSHSGAKHTPIPKGWGWEIANAGTRSATFGAALQRARSLR